MSDPEDYDEEDSLEDIHEEIVRCKRNPATSGMFVSGWDDADEDVDVVKHPKGNAITHVLWAAENGETKLLTELLAKAPGLVHAQDSDGYTPLHRAAYGNHVPALSYLISLGANIHARTELGWTPLHSASNWNNYEAAARLIAAGADVTALSDGEQTPLHLASAMSHCKSTLLVLFSQDEVHEIVKKTNNAGETPERLAQGHGIYGPLYEMVMPAVSFIHSLSFTTNPYYAQGIIINKTF